ncbi:basal-body rod modification protein FlgD [Betaproteobacteria bacterium]|nr:basal-body rod modification protein FlgD [Betaproteobacteria bacterium]GHU13317.1 basal-body rod modification protein FlgD [Betaproteobacteria bacterium]
MAIDPNIINAVNASSSGTKTAAAKTEASAAEEMNQRFMTLFIAQLKNQDPLNPMENAEMTSQLAQMNMVSGLESLNATMKTLLGSYNEALSLQAANLIGKNVLVEGSQVVLTDEGSLFGLDLSAGADDVNVIITDANGKEVARQNLGQLKAGSLAFYWDGMGADGEKLEPGAYRFSVAATLNGEPIAAKTLQAGTVSALVRGSNGNFQIEVAGLGNVNLDDVKQVF